MAGEIRQQINLESLSKYIESNVPVIQLPIEVKQFGYGQSNPTYQLTAKDGTKFVMRKKPPGKLVSKTAHQVDREYRIIHALNETNVPVPQAYCLCEDDSIIGTPFYIMGFLDGRIVQDASFPDVSPKDREAMWKDAVRTLAKLHSVKPNSVGLEDYGKHSEFYNRQIRTFGRISQAQAEAKDVETKQAVGNIPHFEDMVKFFSDPKYQPQDRSTLVHGDYKIDNLVYHKTEPRVIGILDWEMSTIGHPLSDLSNLLNPFAFAEAFTSQDSASGDNLSAFVPDSRLDGIPSSEQLLKWYHEVAGWDPAPELKWGLAFAGFRNSVIMQGIKARMFLRQATSAKAKNHADRAGPFAEYAWSMVQAAQQRGDKSKL